MLYGTNLKNCCEIANTGAEFIEKVNFLFGKEFTQEEIKKREENLQTFNVINNSKLIMELI
jgi:hypothetical protein